MDTFCGTGYNPVRVLRSDSENGLALVSRPEIAWSIPGIESCKLHAIFSGWNYLQPAHFLRSYTDANDFG